MSDRHNKRPHGDGGGRKIKREDSHNNEDLNSSCNRKKSRNGSPSPSSSNSIQSSLRIDPNIIELSDSNSSGNSVQFITPESPGSTEPPNEEPSCRCPNPDEGIRIGLHIHRDICHNRFGIFLGDLQRRQLSPLCTFGALLPRHSRMPGNQQNIWRSQQVDAENRRRRATNSTAPTAGTSTTVTTSTSSLSPVASTAATNSAPSATTSTSTTTSGNNARGNNSRPIAPAPFRAFLRSPDVGESYPNLLEFQQMVMPFLIQDQPVDDDDDDPLDSNVISESVIDNITTEFQYSSTQSVSNKNCTICMEDYKDGEHLRSLPCLHTYHKECIDRWFMEQTKCPICRFNVMDRNAGEANNFFIYDEDSSLEDSQG